MAIDNSGRPELGKKESIMRIKNYILALVIFAGITAPSALGRQDDTVVQGEATAIAIKGEN
jgi:hypothetical protein